MKTSPRLSLSLQISQSAGFFTAGEFVAFRRSIQKHVHLGVCVTWAHRGWTSPLLGRNMLRNCVGWILSLAWRLENRRLMVCVVSLVLLHLYYRARRIHQLVLKLSLAQLCGCFANPSKGTWMLTAWTYTFFACFLAAEELKISTVDFARWLASVLI